MKGTTWLKFASKLIAVFFLFQTVFALSIDKVIVFGDSLSDNGNTFNVTSTIPFMTVIPKKDVYYQGRFSNGPVWVEPLAEALNVPLENYAYGGAWVEPYSDSGQIFPFSLETQVSYYQIASFRDNDRSKHLYIIWAGANDYLAVRTNPEEVATKTVTIIQEQIRKLIGGGAKNILVLNLPDLGVVPGVREKGSEFSALVSERVRYHNAKLAEIIASERAEHTDVNLMTINAFETFNAILANPDNYNIKNVTDSCYSGPFSLRALTINTRDLQAAKKANMNLENNMSLRTAYLTAKLAESGAEPCKNPDDYLFWDILHPTAKVHQFMALYALAELNNHDIT